MWLDRAVKWLLPREEHFFDLLERGADCVRRCGALLAECCNSATPEAREALIGQIDAVEHEADRIAAEVFEALNKTFVTPIDRSDIYSLASTLEEIVDDVFATALQLVVHAVDDLPAGSCEMSALIRDACEAIDGAVKLLRGLKDPAAIRDRCDQLNRMESAGDKVYRTRVGAMFREERDAIRLLKHKEFLEGLERTLDACDDVGNALSTIVIKNA
jgi:uncharacterized protein Yka (UPF0111/DUF47 family)